MQIQKIKHLLAYLAESAVSVRLTSLAWSISVIMQTGSVTAILKMELFEWSSKSWPHHRKEIYEIVWQDLSPAMRSSLDLHYNLCQGCRSQTDTSRGEFQNKPKTTKWETTCLTKVAWNWPWMQSSFFRHCTHQAPSLHCFFPPKKSEIFVVTLFLIIQNVITRENKRWHSLHIWHP